jgi:hypothetical protein
MAKVREKGRLTEACYIVLVRIELGLVAESTVQRHAILYWLESKIDFLDIHKRMHRISHPHGFDDYIVLRVCASGRSVIHMTVAIFEPHSITRTCHKYAGVKCWLEVKAGVGSYGGLDKSSSAKCVSQH